MLQIYLIIDNQYVAMLHHQVSIEYAKAPISPSSLNTSRKTFHLLLLLFGVYPPI